MNNECVQCNHPGPKGVLYQTSGKAFAYEPFLPPASQCRFTPPNIWLSTVVILWIIKLKRAWKPSNYLVERCPPALHCISLHVEVFDAFMVYTNFQYHATIPACRTTGSFERYQKLMMQVERSIANVYPWCMHGACAVYMRVIQLHEMWPS